MRLKATPSSCFDAADVTDNVYITIVNVREQKENGCDAYTHIFSTTCYAGSLQDFSGYDWNVTIADETTVAYDKSKGATFGSGTYPAGKVSLYTEETFGCAVASVSVKAAANGDGELNVFLAGNPIGETVYLGTALETYQFVADEPVSGALEIRLENTQKAMYLKQITINFVKLEDPETPEGIPTISTMPQDNKGQKILLDGKLYILYNGNYYNILGLKVTNNI